MWKDIPGFEDLYSASNSGLIYSKRNNSIIKGDINNAGYSRVTLYNNGQKQRFFRHRLIAELFIDNPYNLPEVNHINGNKMDCRVSNLEFSDRTHNEHEARRNNLKEYKPFKVVWLNKNEEIFEFKSQLSNKLGVTPRTIKNYLENISTNYTEKGILSIEYL